MDQLERQIKVQMRKAMQDLVAELLEKPELSTEDIQWLKELCMEVREKINALTPSRKDLHAEFEAAFDVDLLVQMLAHSAADRSDFMSIHDFTFSRLEMLCAPSQDAEILDSKQKIATETSLARQISVFLYEVNFIAEEIDILYKKFLRKSS